ncbi:MAG: hypothetical protein AAGA45_03000 [Verrucomicrobiota bacterium]
MESIFWIFIAFLILAPGCFGIYLLTSTTDKLTVSYQNFQLRRTSLPLKDEDFSNIPQIIRRLKALGFVLCLFSVLVVGLTVGVA